MKNTVSKDHIEKDFHNITLKKTVFQFFQSLSNVSGQMRCFEVPILGPLHFHINFKARLSISGRKKSAGILIVSVLNLKITLESMAL